MQKKKILLLGHGRHGKDTVADILKDQLGYRLVSSSEFAAEKVMMPFFGDKYATVDDCYEDRHTGNNREVWFQQIQAYNTPDKAKLASDILQVADIYVGMRCPQEFAAAKDLFDVIVWVDATARGLPPEGAGSFGIPYDPDTMVWLDNNGTLERLEERVLELARSW